MSIFSFSIFGEFSELLVNSVLLSAFQYAASKNSVLTDLNFFFLKFIILFKVHMVHELFLSINLVLTAVKLFNIGYLTLFSYQFTFCVWKRGN